MDYFHYKNNELYAEDIAISDIATTIPTPFYLYSKKTLDRHYRVFDEALNLPNKLICFAVKSNSNLSVIRSLVKKGSGIDTVSQGEIFKSLKAGADPQKIVFSGVGKTKEEIIYALNQNILQFNTESQEEIAMINDIAESLGKKASIAVRINPNIDAQTDNKISTGRKGDKFGIDIDIATDVIKYAIQLKNINFLGISMHIGSQIIKLEPFEKAFKKAFDFVQNLEKQNIKIRSIDLGGGLGVPYGENDTILPKDYGDMIKKLVQKYNFVDKKFIFEPGRLITANAGILITKVVLIKKTQDKNFLIVDSAMNDFIRPALYSAKPTFMLKNLSQNINKIKYDIVGPVCETTDFFIKNIELPELSVGSILALRSCGAYGAVLSSEYNARPLIAEIMVSGDKFFVVRKKPSLEQMISNESIADFID